MSTRKVSCGECYFFDLMKKYGPSAGECKRYPPLPQVGWPSLHMSNWCGEWKDIRLRGEAIMDNLIDAEALGTRITNILASDDIFKYVDLVNHSEEYLASLRGLGDTSLDIIRDHLRGLGLAPAKVRTSRDDEGYIRRQKALEEWRKKYGNE
jgi:hypothetical protein